MNMANTNGKPDNGVPQTWRRACKTLPTIKLEVESEFAFKHIEGVPVKSATRACKTLGIIRMTWDELPPMLDLEFELSPAVDGQIDTQKIGEVLGELDARYKALGGEGLNYNLERALRSAVNG